MMLETNSDQGNLRDWLFDELEIIIVDADDTIWYDARYYSQVRSCLIELAAAYGYGPGSVRELINRCRTNLPSGEEGYSTSLLFCAEQIGLREEDSTMLVNAIESFKKHPIVLLPYARKTLEIFESMVDLVLLSKGVEKEQIRKLEHSRLSHLFKHIEIVQDKGPENFVDFLTRLGACNNKTLMIGNSIREDIIPAVSNDVKAIWINHIENFYGRDGEPPASVLELDGWQSVFQLVSQHRRDFGNDLR
jgi:putative hydrolase of the HAD superfamily